MARKRLFEEAEMVPETNASTEPSSAVPEVERRNATTPKRYSVAARNHVSFYLPREMQEAAKRVALDRGMKANDLYLEGLRRVLEEAGYTREAIGYENQ